MRDTFPSGSGLQNNGRRGMLRRFFLFSAFAIYDTKERISNPILSPATLFFTFSMKLFFILDGMKICIYLIVASSSILYIQRDEPSITRRDFLTAQLERMTHTIHVLSLCFIVSTPRVPLYAYTAEFANFFPRTKGREL